MIFYGTKDLITAAFQQSTIERKGNAFRWYYLDWIFSTSLSMALLFLNVFHRQIVLVLRNWCKICWCSKIIFEPTSVCHSSQERAESNRTQNRNCSNASHKQCLWEMMRKTFWFHVFSTYKVHIPDRQCVLTCIRSTLWIIFRIQFGLHAE